MSRTLEARLLRIERAAKAVSDGPIRILSAVPLLRSDDGQELPDDPTRRGIRCIARAPRFTSRPTGG